MKQTINSLLSGRAIDTAQFTNSKPRNSLKTIPNGNSTDVISSAMEQRGLRRLNSALASDLPLKDNVPRGYYLNILV